MILVSLAFSFIGLGNFIPHNINKLKQQRMIEQEYLLDNKQYLTNPEYQSAPIKMKLLSPKVFEIKEQLSKKNISSHQQKRTKETLKYIAIYRKVIRNNKALSSSRTDLKHSNPMNQSDLNIKSINNWSKCSYANSGINPFVPNYDNIPNSIQSDFVMEHHKEHSKSSAKSKIGLPHLPKRSINESLDGANDSMADPETARKSLTNRSKSRQYKSVTKEQAKVSHQLPTIERHLHESQTFMKTLKLKGDIRHELSKGKH